VITDHRLQNDHDFDWQNVEILDVENYYNKWLISGNDAHWSTDQWLNLQHIVALNYAYTEILNKL